jgi:hypothetical protein
MKKIGDLVSLDQFIDKTIIAKVKLNVRSYPSTTGSIIAVIPRGNNVGRVYSWVKGKDKEGKNDGSYWFMYWDKFNGKTGYTIIEGKYYDLTALKDQGVKSVKEVIEEKKKKEEEENKSWFEKIFGDLNLKDGIKKVLIGGAIIYVVVKLGQTAILKQKT